MANAETLSAAQRWLEREFEALRASMQGESAIIRRRLDAAGVPDLTEDEKAAIRLGFKAGPPSPPPETPPTVLGKPPRRSGRGSRT